MTKIAPDGTVYDLIGPDDGPVVVLIHGLGLNRGFWQWTKPALSDHYRVLSYDLAGHGQSPASSSPPSLRLFSEQLEGLMDLIAVRSASIVGFALGGMIARRAAQDMPDRLDALAILHSPHMRSPEAQEAIEKRIDAARTDGPSATVEAALSRWFTQGYRANHPAMMDLFRHWLMANDSNMYHTNYRLLVDGIDEIIRPDPPIACPTLVMTGEEDYANGPEMAAAIAAEIDGAETHIRKGLGHMALAEDPAGINVALRGFLDRTIRDSAP